MQKAQVGASLSGQKTKAMLLTLQQNDALWPALLVAAGTLFLLSVFPFYPLWLIFILAALTGAIAYSYPPGGTLAGVLLAFPAIAYQAPIFAWPYTLVIAVCLFEVFTEWSLISFLKIIICAPFAPFPLSLLGGFVQFGLTLGALYSGSKRSILMSIPAVTLIILLSTLWLEPNSSFMLTKSLGNDGIYAPSLPAFARNAQPEPTLAQIPAEILNLPSRLFSGEVISQVNPALAKIGDNLAKMLISDSAILQLVAWTGVLFLVGFLPARLQGAHKQLMAGSIILFIPLTHFLISQIYEIPFPLEIVPYTIASIFALAILERSGMNIARERDIIRGEKTKKFGKFGVEDLADSAGPQSLDEVGGYDDVKAELREAILMPLQQKELSVAYGIKPPRGILLFGPPGTGKTMLMRALSKELGIGFYYIKCSEILSEWYGESEKNITELFQTARKTSPCILFFDEIDSIGKKRDSYSADDVAPRVLSVLLTEIDGFQEKNSKPVIIIGATNAPDSLDNALIRPGRLDKIIYMPLPDAKAREAVLKVHLSKVPAAPDLDLAQIVRKTERFSGADLGNVVSEATRLAAREAKAKNVIVPVSQKHILTVLSGMRPSVGIDALENYERFRLDFERRVGGTAGSIEEEQKKEAAIKWSDVVGLEQVRKTLLEAIEIPLLHEDLIKKYKIKPAKGLLLFGPPGCGKTMIVRAASNELSATFLTLSGADITRKGPENAVRTLRETFNRAREQPPSLIFIDEIEALAPSRTTYSSPVLTQLLQELDGVKELKNVMLIGATNKPSQIDNALLRPGRFDKIIYIPPPDAKGRAALFSSHLADVSPGIDFNALAKVTAGYSGADIASVCQEAKMKLVRAHMAGGETKLTTEDVMEVIASRRPSISDSDLAEYQQFVREYGERK